MNDTTSNVENTMSETEGNTWRKKKLKKRENIFCIGLVSKKRTKGKGRERADTWQWAIKNSTAHPIIPKGVEPLSKNKKNNNNNSEALYFIR